MFAKYKVKSIQKGNTEIKLVKPKKTMKPIKQTVYLGVISEDNISLEVIDINTKKVEMQVEKQEGYFFTTEQLNQLLSDVIKNTLNTASENAYVEYIDLETNKKI